VDGGFQRDCSERTAEEIDAEVRKILEQAYSEAKDILVQHRDQLELVTGELLKNETLDSKTLAQLIGKTTTAEHGRPGPAIDIAPPALSSGHAEK